MIYANSKKEFPYPKNKIWQIVTDNTYYAWRSDLSKIEIVDETHFIEYTKKGYPTDFTITVKQECAEYRFKLRNSNLHGIWSGIFRELPNGNTELELTEEIEVQAPLMKLLAKPYLKSQQKRYIRDLEKALHADI